MIPVPLKPIKQNWPENKRLNLNGLQIKLEKQAGGSLQAFHWCYFYKSGLNEVKVLLENDFLTLETEDNLTLIGPYVMWQIHCL